jgi:Helix-turn-helix domain
MDQDNRAMRREAAMEAKLHNKSKLWALMLIDSDFDDAGLSLAARGVYVHLCRRADKAHVAWPGIDSIADTVRANRKTVIAAIRELEQRGFLRVMRAWGCRSNYEILPKHCWKALPQTDQSTIGTDPEETPLLEADQSLERTRPHEELVPEVHGTGPNEGTLPVRLRERKDNQRRITKKNNDDNAHVCLNESTRASSSRPDSLAVGAENASGFLAPRIAGLVNRLTAEFALSNKQRQAVREYCDSRGLEYVSAKAEIVRSQPRRNAAGALLAALHDDWQPAVVTGPLADSDDLAARMGWQW